MMENNRLFMILIVLVCSSGTAWSDESFYIQAVKTGLLAEPKMGVAQVEELKRGDQVDVLEKKGLWYQVRHGSKTGWVSRLFLADHKPVGSADLSKDVNLSLEKASRRRSSSYAVSASTRGLSADERVRGGRSLYHSDFQALSDVESQSVSKEDLDSFRSAAQLDP